MNEKVSPISGCLRLNLPVLVPRSKFSTTEISSEALLVFPTKIIPSKAPQLLLISVSLVIYIKFYRCLFSSRVVGVFPKVLNRENLESEFLGRYMSDVCFLNLFYVVLRVNVLRP